MPKRSGTSHVLAAACRKQESKLALLGLALLLTGGCAFGNGENGFGTSGESKGLPIEGQEGKAAVSVAELPELAERPEAPDLAETPGGGGKPKRLRYSEVAGGSLLWGGAERFELLDLNGDGALDLVVFHAKDDRSASWLEIWLWSRQSLAFELFRAEDVPNVSINNATVLNGEARDTLAVDFNEGAGGSEYFLSCENGEVRWTKGKLSPEVDEGKFRETRMGTVRGGTATALRLGNEGRGEWLAVTDRSVPEELRLFLGVDTAAIDRHWLADLNKDGSDDLLLGKKLPGNGGYEVVLSVWDGTTYPDEGLASARLPADSVGVGDVDGDGRPELLAVRGNDAYVWEFDVGSGAFYAKGYFPIRSGEGRSLAATDADGDGKPEILA